MEQLFAKSKDGLSSFIRLYLMRNGKKVARYNVYSDFKLEAETRKEQMLETLHSRAQQLANLFVDVPTGLMPKAEAGWIRAMDMSSFFPLMFQLLDQYDGQDLAFKAKELGRHLLNIMVRRFLVTSNSNEVVRLIGAILRDQLSEEKESYYDTLLNRLTIDLCPNDEVVAKAVPSRPLYDQPGIVVKCRAILEMLETGYGHKEQADFTRASIEHLAPQNNREWINALTEEDLDDYNQWIHTLGNLTLTGYNSELSNKTWAHKQLALGQSHYELNRYFADQPIWNKATALARAEALVPHICKVFAIPVEVSLDAKRSKVKEKSAPKVIPRALLLDGMRIEPNTWSNLAVLSLTYLANKYPFQFNKWAERSSYLANEVRYPIRLKLDIDPNENGTVWYFDHYGSSKRHVALIKSAWRAVGGADEDFVMEYDVNG